MPRETLDLSLLQATKRAIDTPDQMAPPGGDPMGGGMPPDPMMDPMAGGMPPDPMAGGMPPDPMMGGMPPDPMMDPMAGGMPPPPAEVPAEEPAEATVTVPVTELFKFILDLLDHTGKQSDGASDLLTKLLGGKSAQEHVPTPGGHTAPASAPVTSPAVQEFQRYAGPRNADGTIPPVDLTTPGTGQPHDLRAQAVARTRQQAAARRTANPTPSRQLPAGLQSTAPTPPVQSTSARPAPATQPLMRTSPPRQ